MTSTDWREAPAPGEEAEIEAATAVLTAIQGRAAGNGSKRRALHAKGLVAARVELIVDDSVPEHLRQGLFAAPARFSGMVRFSNAAARVQSDASPDVRGMAVQLEGLSGPRALGAADRGATQDLLAFDRTHLPFRDVREFAAMQRVAFSPLPGLFSALFALGPSRLLSLVKVLTAAAPAPTSLAEHTFHSGAPIRVGPHAAHFSFVPLAKATDGAKRTKDSLGDELRARLAKESVTFALELRLFASEGETPIEDPSRPWTTPSVRVATLVLPMQDAAAARDRAEAASFDPWHALDVHRPLGPLMRARKAAYFASVSARQAKALPPS